MAKKKLQQTEEDDEEDIMEEEEELDDEEEEDIGEDIESEEIASTSVSSESGELDDEEDISDEEELHDNFDSSVLITDDEVTDTDGKWRKNTYVQIKQVQEHERITKPFLSKYEKTRIIATRAHQIARGSMPFINFERDGNVDPVQLAEEELRQRKTPLIVRRKLPSGFYEDWRVEELVDIYLD